MSENRTDHLQQLLRIYTVLYALFGIFLLGGNKLLFDLLNAPYRFFRLGVPMRYPTEPFWSFVVVSLLFTLSFICYQAQKEIQKSIGLVVAMIFCKFVSSFLLITYFLLFKHAFGYLIGGSTDFSLGIIALFFLNRSRSRACYGNLRAHL